MHNNTLKSRFEQFLKRATEQHNKKFDYSQVKYLGATTNITIICPTHGQFQQTPDRHTRKNAKGCPACWNDMRSQIFKSLDKTHWKKPEILPVESFLEKCRNKFGSKFTYDLSNYTGMIGNAIKITCPDHGQFLKTPTLHLERNHGGCLECAKQSTTKSSTFSYAETISACQKAHKNKYEYPDYNQASYKNRQSIIDIICPKHGKFRKKTAKHLAGQACYRCNIDNLIATNQLVGGYSEELFQERPELKNYPATIYYLKINNGQLYKIGITRQDSSKRIAFIKSESKIPNIVLVKEFHSTLYECFRLEQQILNENKIYRVYSQWSTELFTQDISNSLNKYFNNI